MECLLDFINEIKKDTKCENYRDLEDEFIKDLYIHKPLKNIVENNKTIKRNGFIIYSDVTIDDEWSNGKSLYKKYKDVYESCKDFKSIKERYVFRYYYYEKLNSTSTKHATIVMMNPA